MNVYFISGLGTDRRAFQKIRLPSQFRIHHIDWIKHKNGESLDEYAKRLSSVIDQSQSFALVGLSMGGMIASAMNQFLHPIKTILISSISTCIELPWYFKIVGTLRLDKLIPISLIMNKKIVHWLFGAKTNTEKKLIDLILLDADPHFVKWAIGAILRWKKKSSCENMIHIHGSNDKILPLRFTKPDIVINKGSHFMVWTRAAEVSKALTNALRGQSQL